MRKMMIALAFISITCLAGCLSSEGQNSKTGKRFTDEERAAWKKKLTSEQFHIMVEQGTELPYNNAYFDNHEDGVYVSAATGDTLFTSRDKYDSGTGWPSFVQPASKGKVAFISDRSFGTTRTEVVEKSTMLHLGHVFDDGPKERGGKRYCMNSAALKFISKR